jgi:hypothetical protein
MGVDRENYSIFNHLKWTPAFFRVMCLALIAGDRFFVGLYECLGINDLPVVGKYLYLGREIYIVDSNFLEHQIV